MNLKMNHLFSPPSVLKKGIVAILCVIMIGLFFVTCEKKSESAKNLQHVKTELGGCNIQYDLTRGDGEMERDTVIITISEDSVNVFVGYGFVCKTKSFETQVETKDDVICMYIIDVCDEPSEPSDCYAKCMCYYTFDFVFKYQEAINQKYKILLFTDLPGEESPIIISEGIINLEKR